MLTTTFFGCLVSVLLCWLKFIPTPSKNNINLKSNVQTFYWKSKPKVFFENKSKNYFEKEILSKALAKNNSKFFSVSIGSLYLLF